MYCRKKGKGENALMEAFKGGGVAEQEKEGTSNAVRLGIRSVGGGLVV